MEIAQDFKELLKNEEMVNHAVLNMKNFLNSLNQTERKEWIRFVVQEYLQKYNDKQALSCLVNNITDQEKIFMKRCLVVNERPKKTTQRSIVDKESNIIALTKDDLARDAFVSILVKPNNRNPKSKFYALGNCSYVNGMRGLDGVVAQIVSSDHNAVNIQPSAFYLGDVGSGYLVAIIPEKYKVHEKTDEYIRNQIKLSTADLMDDEQSFVMVCRLIDVSNLRSNDMVLIVKDHKSDSVRSFMDQMDLLSIRNTSLESALFEESKVQRLIFDGKIQREQLALNILQNLGVAEVNDIQPPSFDDQQQHPNSHVLMMKEEGFSNCTKVFHSVTCSFYRDQVSMITTYHRGVINTNDNKDVMIRVGDITSGFIFIQDIHLQAKKGGSGTVSSGFIPSSSQMDRSPDRSSIGNDCISLELEDDNNIDVGHVRFDLMDVYEPYTSQVRSMLAHHGLASDQIIHFIHPRVIHIKLEKTAQSFEQQEFVI
jgi:hypothetical protein